MIARGAKIQLPGVDLEEACERLIEDLPFVLSLLKQFVEHALEVEASLSFDGGRLALEDALRKLHLVRGGAANLSAHRLEAQARQLELISKGLHSRQGSAPPPAEALSDIASHRSNLKAELKLLRITLNNTVLDDEDRSAADKTNSAQVARQVLIIDDSDFTRSYLKAALLEALNDVEIIEARDGLSGFRLLVEQAPDLVLCDLQMPEFDGMKLLSLRETRPDLAEVPFIMLSAEEETAKKADALSHGACDYITKPFRREDLVARIRIHLDVKKHKKEQPIP